MGTIWLWRSVALGLVPCLLMQTLPAPVFSSVPTALSQEAGISSQALALNANHMMHSILRHVSEHAFLSRSARHMGYEFYRILLGTSLGILAAIGLIALLDHRIQIQLKHQSDAVRPGNLSQHRVTIHLPERAWLGTSEAGRTKIQFFPDHTTGQDIIEDLQKSGNLAVGVRYFIFLNQDPKPYSLDKEIPVRSHVEITIKTEEKNIARHFARHFLLAQSS